MRWRLQGALLFVMIGWTVVASYAEQSVSTRLDNSSDTVAVRLAPGDYKDGYESEEYRTNSLNLSARVGRAANLVELAERARLGLPKTAVGSHLKPNQAALELGRKLFFDRRLSHNKTMSCAMCHIPEQGFTNNELQRPIGFEGRAIKRNAPTLLNVSHYARLFLDARESRLDQQVWSPLLAHNEMNNASVGQVIDTLSDLPDYAGLFESAFDDKPNMLNVGEALAQYQQALIAANSRFDQWRYGGRREALSDQERAGFTLFTGKAQCSVCHSIGEQHALFTDQQLHNTGVGFQAAMTPSSHTANSPRATQKVRVQLAPGVVGEIAQAVVDSVGEPKPNDVGRYEVTLDPDDRWKFRTASLRNIALTAPYMHNGTIASLDEVVLFYNQGGVQHAGLSPLIKPLDLSVAEQEALVAFMQSLTGSLVAELVSDAFAAPISDTQ